MSPRLREWLRRLRMPALIFALTAGVYLITLGERATSPSPDNHYSHLAASMLEGQLGVIGNRPPGTNDWACYDTETHGSCPPNRYEFPARDRDRYRWYVSFPPLPAAVILPAVAIWGVGVWDRTFWALLAGLAPALLYVLLRFLRETQRSNRQPWEDVLLSLLFAFGTVYYYTSVQGTVWFAAHVVACTLLALYALFAIDARRPLLAGLMLGLAFMCRPTMMGLAPLFLIEALRVSRAADAAAAPEDAWVWKRIWVWLKGVKWKPVARSVALFGAPILVIGVLAMWMNSARFEDPFEFGHRYLQIRWTPRIEKWGLFNYHYLGKNLAVFLAALPWLTAADPFVKMSQHGLALWFTTPNLLTSLWPKRTSLLMTAIWCAVIPVAIWNLLYQNTGWVQFGYRFALDYLLLVIVLIALGGRRFGPGFFLLMAFAILVNTFGAITFDRMREYYDTDWSQNIIFHPD
jgi:hypothetical protein